jgi:hypothetical protein
MHVYPIKSKKIAIFWSPRCGHKSIDKLLRSWNYPHLFTTTHLWKRDLESYDWVINKEKVHRDFTEKITVDSLIGYKKIVLIRDPWKRFSSFWRWGLQKNFINSNITPEKYIKDLDFSREEFDIEHHSMPQFSQASCLLTGDEEYFDLLNFEGFAKRLAELSGNVYYEKEDVEFKESLQSKIRPEIWEIGSEFKIEKPLNFSDIYGDDEFFYQKFLTEKNALKI